MTNLEQARHCVFEAAKKLPKTASDSEVKQTLRGAFKPKSESSARSTASQLEALETVIAEHLVERRKLAHFEGRA